MTYVYVNVATIFSKYYSRFSIHVKELFQAIRDKSRNTISILIFQFNEVDSLVPHRDSMAESNESIDSIRVVTTVFRDID